MAGGGVVSNGKEYPGNFTWRVFITCIVAATGGLIFGYDLGISGGVTSMDPFLQKFFPKVYAKESSAKPSDDQYCKFDSETLTLFTSSLYLAALASSLGASWFTRKFGRKLTMFVGGLLFFAGGLLNGFASEIWMLYAGRILLGLGIGCANQSVPIYISEVAPYKYRGALNMMFQLSITIGILAAGIINYFTAQMTSNIPGWRFSLGLAVVPALIITVGSLFLSDTPSSLIERGKLDEAKTLLVKIRGIPNVDEEFKDLMETSMAANMVKDPWRNLLRNRKYRPQLTFAILIPLFQQLTGMNVFVFYAPVLFRTLGSGSNTALLSSMITNVVNFVATFGSLFLVDKLGRRFFFIAGGVQMLACQIVMTLAIGIKFGISGNPGHISSLFSLVVIVSMCFYIAGFAYSWGPLGWLVPSEIFPLEVRSAAQSINVSVNMLATFLIAQVFTFMLCHLKFGLFIFFALCVVGMTTFIYYRLPETRGIPIEEMSRVWEQHPYWSKFVLDDHNHKPIIHDC
ncbi:hypothetical protein ACFE04_016153 [Oxalis oulophora]